MEAQALASPHAPVVHSGRRLHGGLLCGHGDCLHLVPLEEATHAGKNAGAADGRAATSAPSDVRGTDVLTPKPAAPRLGCSDVPCGAVPSTTTRVPAAVHALHTGTAVRRPQR